MSVDDIKSHSVKTFSHTIRVAADWSTVSASSNTCKWLWCTKSFLDKDNNCEDYRQ